MSVPVAGAQGHASTDGALTVSQLAALIDGALRTLFPAPVRVVGEVSQFRERTHWYFDVKDAESLVSCVMFQSAARRAGFVPAVGQRLLLTGRVEFYAKQGRVSFVVEKVEPVGVGALDLAFRKLCEELRALGWFDDSRKRPLPLLPGKIAVVTSRTGAALQDVIDTVRRRCPSLPLALADVRVQGEGAAPEVAAAIRSIGRRHAALGVDVILLTRGGGSMEDLWAFNERVVAEAIVKSPIPVIAAIGHETDTTIAELVADLRCATPTQAAMRIAPDAEALREQLRSFGARLLTLARRQARTDAERVRGLMRHALFADPASIVHAGRQRADAAARRLAFAARDTSRDTARRLDRAAARLERQRPAALYANREARLRHAAARLGSAWATVSRCRSDAVESAARGLDLVGPHSVLSRGYSVTLAADGRIIRSVREASAGDTVRTRLADGSFTSTVAGGGGDRVPVPATGQARRPGRRPPMPKEQMDLFRPGG